MTITRLRRPLYHNALIPLLFCALSFKPSAVWGESLEIRLTDIEGLTKEINGQAEYMVFVHECSPICSLIGAESLAEMNSAHVISSEGIIGSFRLSITLRRRTRPPPQQRQDIPVEVLEHEGGSEDMVDLSRETSETSFGQPQSNFEPYGRVLLTGSNPGEKGNLNDNWRFIDEVVAQFFIDTTISAIRRCRKSCRFSSEAPFVKRTMSNGSLENPTFKLQLTAFRESAGMKSAPEDLLFAGYFAEAAEKSLTEDLRLPFPFPGKRESDASHRIGSANFRSTCNKYRFVSAVGGDVAYVWRLSTIDGNDEHDRRDQLDTGSSQDGTTVVVFKDIPKSSAYYADIWGRNELLPVSFSGSAPYDHFGSFGKVHKGFHTRYNQVAEELRTWLRPGASVLVAGYFAGGAMAALAFADWLSDSNMDLGMTFGVTFGASQVGDKLFQKAFREMGRYEPTKASYGFFEQLIAADEHSGKADITTRFPSTIFESFVPYPCVHSIDCLRSVFHVEKIALSSPGHLRTFRSIGRRRFLYARRHLSPPSSQTGLDRKFMATASNDTLRDLADSYFTINGDAMSHYMERLASLYADRQLAIHSNDRTTIPNFNIRVAGLSISEAITGSDCKATEIPPPTEKLSISVQVYSKTDNLHRALGVNLCPSCSPDTPFNESLCRPMAYTGNTTHPGYGLLPLAMPLTALTFSSLRPTPPQTCVQFSIYRLRKPQTCATDRLPKEVVRVATAPLLELVEVVECTAKRRCGMEFEGMRLMIAARVKALVEKEVKRGGWVGGVLTREKGVGKGTEDERTGGTGGGESIQDDEKSVSGVGVADKFADERGFGGRDEQRSRSVFAGWKMAARPGEVRHEGEFNGGGLRSVGNSDGENRVRGGQIAGGVGGAGDEGDVDSYAEMSSKFWDVSSDFQQFGKGGSLKGRRDGEGLNSEKALSRHKPRLREFAHGEGLATRGNGSVLQEDSEMTGALNRRDRMNTGRLRKDEGRKVIAMGDRFWKRGDERYGSEAGMARRLNGGSGSRADGAIGREGRRSSLWKSGMKTGTVEQGSGCEMGRWCECGAVRVDKCVRRIVGREGWCEVGGCVEMRCRCGGGRRCEKRVGVVYRVVEQGGAGEGVGDGGARERRCVRGKAEVVVEV